MLHARLFSLLHPGGEILAAAEEMAVFAHDQRHAGCAADALEVADQAPLARLNHDHTHGLRMRERRCQRVSERGVRMSAGGVVVDMPVARAQRIAEVPHRREEDRDARLVAPGVGGLRRCFADPDRVLPGIECRESRGSFVELIAEDQDEVAHRGVPS